MNTRWMAIAALVIISTNLPCAQAQNKSEAAGLSGLAHVDIRVSDVDREVAFFGKLGFEQAFANTKDGKTIEAYIKVNDVQFIAVSAANPPQRPAGFSSAGFESADLNALNALYSAAGLKPTEVRKGSAGNPLFSVTASDGSVTFFIQYTPDSRYMQVKGQHLGVRRISEELLGFDFPVKDLTSAQTFYETLGLDAEKDGDEVRLSLPSSPDLLFELHLARANDQPQLLLSVADAKRAENELRDAGLKVERREKMDVVQDPDGNIFDFMQAEQDSTHHSHIPKRHK